MTDPEIRARVTASRAAKGLPPTVENLAVIERVAKVFDLVPAPRQAQDRRAEAA